MKHVRCQMCQHLTHDPKKVYFRGWNRELLWPVQINLCARCNEIWIPDVKFKVIDVSNMSKKEAESIVESYLKKTPFYYKKVLER